MTISRTVFASTTVLALALVGTTGASASNDRHETSRVAEFDLPVGFQPEGIDIALGRVAFLGSLADGSIYRADLRTGAGRVFSPATGSPAVGIELDRFGRLFVAGGPSGTARVVNGITGRLLAQYTLPGSGMPGFVNDVVVTRDAAWFTDSAKPVLYRVPLGRFGQLPSQGAITAIPLTGDLAYDTDPATFEVNGIETTPDRSALIVVQSRTGKLFRVNGQTGATVEVDLGGESITNGDGLTRDGRTLYAVQNFLNQVAVITLSKDGTSGEVERRITDPRFDVPTTVAVSGDHLYLPNARFGVASPTTASYSVVGVPLG